MNSYKAKENIKITIKKLLITAIVMGVLIVVALIFNIPNPNMLLITGLVVFTSLYGYAAGSICALGMVLYSMYFFSTDHSFFQYSMLNFQKMAMILLSAILNVVFVGKLKQMQSKAEEELRDINEVLKKDNSELKEASQTDSLTGLKNRFALRRDYQAYQNHKIFVALLDIDDFKTTNDNYGHVVGDYILNKTGEILMDVFGKEGCYRYGGDEFLIIKMHIDRDKFSSLMKELKSRLAQVYLYNNKIPVHFSGGFVYGKSELQSDLRMMIKHADKHLYESKKQGKNCFAGSEFRRAFAERSENIF